eukprot:4618621-Amphidinium_carterae.1
MSGEPEFIYKQGAASDMLTEEELRRYEKEVVAADKKEIDSFVTHRVFAPKLKQLLPAGIKLMTCIMLRKWKRMQDGTRVIKSRLCAR